MKREAIPEIVHFYMTGKSVIPDYAKRIKVEIIVGDSMVNHIVGDISDSLRHGFNKCVLGTLTLLCVATLPTPLYFF